MVAIIIAFGGGLLVGTFCGLITAAIYMTAADADRSGQKKKLVLGRTKAGTLELREDEKGLFGTIRIDPNDSAAMDLYERVSRGDVDGCSFGFNIRKEESNIEARSKDAGAIRAGTMKAWREAILKKLKAE